MEKLSVDEKKLKALAKDVETKKSSKTVDRGKNKSTRRTRRTVSQKISSKTGRSFKKFFCQNKLSISQSNHFRYGAFTNSSMEIFDRVRVLEILI